jgi:hypothetical protein
MAYTPRMEWTKTARDQWRCEVAPDARFTLKAFIKGDGRWTWEVFSGATENPMASGHVGSLGAAKNASEGFLTRAGYT